MSESDAREKFAQAVWTLATGTGTIRQRVLSAFVAFAPLPASDFPQELRDEYDAILTALTKLQAKADQSSVLATLSEMTDEEAGSLAEQIVTLSQKLDSHRGDDT